MNLRAQDSRHSGFTLVEMMVSMAVASVVLLTAAYLLGGTGDSYDRVGGNVAAEREARAAIAQMRSDMESALHHPAAPFSNSADTLAFLSLQPAIAQSDAGRIGDVCAVNYRLTDLPVGNRVTRVLVRGFRESAETFASLKSGSASGLFDPRDLLDEPVAFGVLAFDTNPVVRDETGGWRTWSPAGGDAPEAVDLRLVLARRETLGRLRTAGDWDAATSRADNAENESDLEVYETRIRFGHDDGS